MNKSYIIVVIIMIMVSLGGQLSNDSIVVNVLFVGWNCGIRIVEAQTPLSLCNLTLARLLRRNSPNWIDPRSLQHTAHTLHGTVLCETQRATPQDTQLTSVHDLLIACASWLTHSCKSVMWEGGKTPPQNYKLSCCVVGSISLQHRVSAWVLVSSSSSLSLAN